MNDLLRQIYATGFVQDAAGNPVKAFPSGVPRESGAILYDLVRRPENRATLEVGTGFGLSTLHCGFFLH